MQQTHFFLALPLSTQLKTTLKDWTDILQNDVKFKKWVHPEDYHITLAFLGNSESDRLEKLSEKLVPVIESHMPFSLELTRLGTFGTPKKPRILWCGTSESAPLKKLQKAVFDTCIHTGYSLDKRPFKPHITLARRYEGNEGFPELSDEGLKLKQSKSIKWNVGMVKLYQTNMDKTPKYETVKEFRLSGI